MTMKLKLNMNCLNFLKKTKLFILDLVFPNRCPFCNDVIKYDLLVCDNCSEKMHYLMNYCRKCGKIECQCDKLYRFDKCDVCAVYDSFMQKAILNLKHGNGENLVYYVADDLCRKLSENINLSDLYCVTSVPSSKNNDYDQSKIIAKVIAKRLNLKTDFNLIKRTNVKRPKQHTLSDSQRRKNVKGMYSFRDSRSDDIKGKSILICDYVLTTGSTLNECARILKANGAAQVFCCTIAVTEKNYCKNL